jgi:hypothetical protein
MQADPNNLDNQKTYVSQVEHLATILLRKYKVSYTEHSDHRQDLLEVTWRRGLPAKVDPKQNAFAYYWTTMAREIWKIKERAGKDCTYVQHYGIFKQKLTDNNEGQNDMMRKLGFSLDEFEEIPDPFSLPAVTTSRPKKGKSKSNVLYPNHWEKLFNHLRENKMELAENLVKKLPKKQRELANPVGACKTYLKAIAEREGYALKVQGDRVFSLYAK